MPQNRHPRKIQHGAWIALSTSALMLFWGNQPVPVMADPTTLNTQANSTNDPMVIDSSWKNIAGGHAVEIYATNSTHHSNGTNTLQSTSEYLLVFTGVSRDLNNVPFTVGDAVANQTTANSTYYSGKIQQVKLDNDILDAIYLPNSVVRLMAKHTPVGKQAVINYPGGAGTNGFEYISFAEPLQGTATATLPTLQVPHSTKTAADNLTGQLITLTDKDSGQQLGSMTLAATDITVQNNSSDSGSYAYNLTDAGKQKVTDKISSLQSIEGIKYSLDSIKSGMVTIQDPPKIEGSVEYLDDDGNSVQTTPVSAVEGQENHYQVEVPAGYELADGQTQLIPYTWTSSGNNVISVRLKKTIKDTGTVTSTGSSGSDKGPAKNRDNSSSTTIRTNKHDATPQPGNTTSVNKRSVSAQSIGSVEVQYIDVSSGQILESENFVGVIGQPVPFDTSSVISKYIARRYVVMQNDTNLSPYFTRQHSVRRVLLQPMTVPTTGLPSQSNTTANPPSRAQNHVPHSKDHKSKPDWDANSANKHQGKSKKMISHPQIIVNNRDLSMSSSNNNGGGDSMSTLARYFIALSGKINFGA